MKYLSSNLCIFDFTSTLILVMALAMLVDNTIAKTGQSTCKQIGGVCKYSCATFLETHIATGLLLAPCGRLRKCCKVITCSAVGGVCKGKNMCNKNESRVEGNISGCGREQICCKQNPNGISWNAYDCRYKINHNGEPIFSKSIKSTPVYQPARQKKGLTRRHLHRKIYY